MTTFVKVTDEAVDLAARILYEQGRIYQPYDSLPLAAKRQWQTDARAILVRFRSLGVVAAMLVEK